MPPSSENGPICVIFAETTLEIRSTATKKAVTTSKYLKDFGMRISIAKVNLTFYRHEFKNDCKSVKLKYDEPDKRKKRRAVYFFKSSSLVFISCYYNSFL